MKKSKCVELVLISAALASCQQQQKEPEWQAGGSKTYLRSDTTAPYTQARQHNGVGGAGLLLWYYAFRPYGGFGNNGYQRAGYYSNGLSRASNIGSNSFKGTVSRGGFGRRSSVSS
ncbi:MAG: hypothetical protein JWP69_1780 [Flaviaesturariibacter sp.]|nr:hypothetical protein [Flaviaesturariibacter sp.]